ncbi:GMC oxidoreductase [Thalassotalea fusca]
MAATNNYDVIVVGAGAAGAVFINRFAKAGLKVLALEKGPHYRDHKQDFYESELAISKLLWDNNAYQVSGKAFRGTPNLGKAVGGGTLAWTAVALRFFERDFEFVKNWGDLPGTSVANWPIKYRHLHKYYNQAELDMGVSGEATVWDHPEAPLPPNPPLDFYRTSYKYQQGFEQLGLNWSAGRLATNSVVYDERPACLHCGFCRAGCRVDAKYQADTVLIEPALLTGNVTLLTEKTVTRLITKSRGKSITSVEFADNKTLEKSTCTATVVVVCNNPIETPRLLLASTSDAHPNGIGNKYDQVGRHFFCHLGTIGLGFTNEDLRMGVGHNMSNVMSLDTCKNENGDYAGGYTLISLNGAGAGVAALDPLVAVNGIELKELMKRYNESLMFMSFVEGLPVADNRITLVPDQLDSFGVPQAHVHYEYHPNDKKALTAAQEKISELLTACGADPVFVSPEFEAHPMGTMRMGHNPRESVTDARAKVHGVRNLYIGGASLFVTGSSVNPTLTLHALALRTSQHILRKHFGVISHDN